MRLTETATQYTGNVFVIVVISVNTAYLSWLELTCLLRLRCPLECVVEVGVLHYCATQIPHITMTPNEIILNYIIITNKIKHFM